MKIKFKGFTLIELLAVIAILAIVLLIAVPKVIDIVESAKKSSFENDAKMIEKAINIKKVQDSSFNVEDINESTIESLLGISGDKYENISIIPNEDEYIFNIEGKNSWEDLIVYGSSGDIEVVNLKKSTIIETFDIGLDLVGNLYSNGTLIISGTGEPYENYEINNGQDNIEKVFFKEGITKLSNGMFAGISSLESVVLPNSLITIGESTFYSCTSLRTVIFGKNLVTIGVAAFNNCTSLEKVVLGNEVEEILDSAFGGCTSLLTVNLNNSPVAIDVAVFIGCTSLVKFHANSVLSIDQAVFNGCGMLSDVKLGNQITSIGSAAFVGAINLKEITLPETLVSSSWAFQESGITTATIYSEHISDFTFRLVSSLKNVIIGNSVLSIGNSAFQGLASLETVSIGNSVQTIGNDAFQGCTSLTKITIPSSVTTLGNFVFVANPNIISIYFEGNAPTTVGTTIVSPVHANFKIYYHSGATGFTNPWKSYPTAMY